MVSSKGEWKLKNKNERKNVLFLQKCIFLYLCAILQNLQEKA